MMQTLVCMGCNTITQSPLDETGPKWYCKSCEQKAFEKWLQEQEEKEEDKIKYTLPKYKK